MIVWDKNEIKIGTVKNADKMPYTFSGKNTANSTIWINIKPTCGCSIMDPWKEVKAKQVFSITGYMTKRTEAPRNYRKKVVVHYHQTNKEGIKLGNEDLFFEMDIIE